jgi:signal transduction histidine kinase
MRRLAPYVTIVGMSQETGASPPATERPATERPATERPATERPATERPGRDALKDSTLLSDRPEKAGKTQRRRRDKIHQAGTDVRWVPVVVYGALVLALAGLAWLAGPTPGALMWPLIVAVIGAVIIWRQADPELWRSFMASRAGRTLSRPEWLRGIFGALLVISGLLGFLASRGQLAEARPGLAAAGAIIAGVGVIVAPWLLRMARELDTERQARTRATEREELAARIHDSVLHTLTMIQRGAEDPRLVQRLARSQERELRAWLYQPGAQSAAQTSDQLSAQLDKIAGEIEDTYGVPIDVVRVGDLQLGDRTRAALNAAREAMLNAAKYSGSPQISVYAEAESERLSIFVRDRGSGFSMDDIPKHRLGVRQSIIGRMDRVGGAARIRTAPGEGTEVEIELMRHA